MTPCLTSRWWRWCQRMRRQRSTIRAVNFPPSRYPAVAARMWNARTDVRTHVNHLSVHRVVNWIKQMVPQPILVPPGAVVIESTNKPATRSSLDKSTKTHKYNLKSAFLVRCEHNPYLSFVQLCLHHLNLSVESHWTLTAKSLGRFRPSHVKDARWPVCLPVKTKQVWS